MLPAFSPFPAIFAKGFLSMVNKTQDGSVKGKDSVVKG